MDDYRKRLSWAKLRVGIVVTAALLILLFTVLFAGNIERFFAPRTALFALFDDVKGLRRGAPVWFSGVQIGSVDSLSLNAGEQITVVLAVERNALQFLKQDSRASILTLGLLGDKYVEVSPGSKEAEGLKPGDTISGTSRPELNEALSRFADKIENQRGSLGRLLEEDTFYRDLSAAAQDIRLFAAGLRKSEGTVNKIIKDPALYDRFVKASESLDGFARRLSTSKGTVSRLIEDESLYENLNTAALKLNVLLDKVNKGDGTVGSLVNNRETGEELQKTLKELNNLVKDMRENPKKYFQFSVF